MIDLLYACKAAYRKHHLGDESIGWEELSDILKEALCNAMGDDDFYLWVQLVENTEQAIRNQPTN